MIPLLKLYWFLELKNLPLFMVNAFVGPLLLVYFGYVLTQNVVPLLGLVDR